MAGRVVYAGAITGVLKQVAGWEREYKDSSKRYTLLAHEDQDVRAENRLTHNELLKFLAWPELQAHWAEAKSKQQVYTAREMAIYALYLGIPPGDSRITQR